MSESGHFPSRTALTLCGVLRRSFIPMREIVYFMSGPRNNVSPPIDEHRQKCYEIINARIADKKCADADAESRE